MTPALDLGWALSAHPWLFIVAAAVTGAVMASFAGLVADRLPEATGVAEPRFGGEPRTLCRPASSCDACGARIPLPALTPVLGWLATKGRCPECKSKTSWTYPAVEFATASASAGIAAAYGWGETAALALALLWFLVALSWADVLDHWLPETLTVPLFFLGLVASPFESDPMARILGATVACFAVAASVKLVARMRRTSAEAAVAGGDVALAAAGGAWLGLSSTPTFLVVASLAYVAYAAPLRAAGRRETPMGPGLSVGMLVVAFADVGPIFKASLAA